MKKLFGVMLIIIALLALFLVYRYVLKKGTYRCDITGMLIDSIEFLALIGALILVGIVLIKT